MKKNIKKSFALKPMTLLLSGILPFSMCAHAQIIDYTWTGLQGNNNFIDPGNWVPLGTVYYEDNRIINTSNGQIIQLDFTDSIQEIGNNGGALIIGSNGGIAGVRITNQSTWELDFMRQLPMFVNVGINGGQGMVEIIYGDTDFDGINLQNDLFNIGAGVNSVGVVSILGSGKIPSTYYGTTALTTSQLHVAQDGATGVLNLNGGSVEIDGGRADYTGAPSVFTLGSGANSSGTVNVLGGGKLAVSSMYSPSEAVRAFIGTEGGTGLLNVDGSAIINEAMVKSRAIFSQGLKVGQGPNSKGTINVTNGAQLATMIPRDDNYTDNTTYLGLDGGSADILISGTGSEWIVAGKTSYYGSGGYPPSELGELHVGETGTAQVTVANGGSLIIGTAEYINVAEENYEQFPYGYIELIANDEVSGDLHLGYQPTGTGTLNIGAKTGELPQAPGLLQINQINFGAGKGTLAFNHNDLTGTYEFSTPLISGSGESTIEHINGVTVFNTSQPLFTGNTNIRGGTMVINGLLGGSVEVSGTGILAGTGIIGPTVIKQNGQISPGGYYSAIPGFIDINGGLTIEPGGIYTVDLSVTPTYTGNVYLSDYLLVNGDAYIDGAITNIVLGNIPSAYYVIGARWKILTANNVIGQFVPLPEKAFLQFTHEYDPQNAYLVITRKDVSMCTSWMTANECYVGEEIENSLHHQLYDIILWQQTMDEVRKGYNQLSGEIYASAKSAMIEDSRFLREAMNTRMRDNQVNNRYGAWAQPFGSWSKTTENGNHAEIKRNIAGLFFGADMQLTPQWQAGLVGGFSFAKVESEARNSKVNRDDYHFGAYTEGKWNRISLRTGLGYSRYESTAKRRINFEGFQDSLKADYDADVFQLYLEGSYQFKLGEASSIEPFINTAYIHLQTRAFNEQGNTAALQLKKDNMDIGYSTVGTRVKHTWKLKHDTELNLWGSIGWRHAYGNLGTYTNLSFRNDGKSSKIAGIAIEKDSALLELGLEATIKSNFTAGISYNGQFGRRTKDHGANAFLRYRF